MSATRIPKKIHFIYGLKADFGGIPFGFAHWVAVRTAKRCNPDYEIHFWYEHKPDNLYFRDIENDVILHHVKAPESIFGNPIPHFAHRADVLRLQVLIEHGGIYLDVDTITVKPFDELLSNRAFMARVKNAGNLYGLCNAVMGGQAEAPFLKAMLDGFRHFRSQGYDQYYDEIGSTYPLRLAQQMPGEITVYDEHAFFVPDMTIAGLTQLFLETGSYPQAWCHHLWEKNAIKVLSRFNERNYTCLPCTYTAQIKRLIPEECDRLAEARRSWCEEQLASRSATLSICLGSPFRPEAINADSDICSGADSTFDPGRDPWPYPDNTFSSIHASRVLETLPDDGEHFFKELYRVSENGCNVHIRITHPRCDAFIHNHSFTTAWLPEAFTQLNKTHCAHLYFSDHNPPAQALKWNVDFDVVRSEVALSNPGLTDHLTKIFSQPPLQVLSITTNSISSFQVALRARKH